MPNIRFVLEYDGSRFHGWQVQPKQRTIQGELHKVLELILREKIKAIHASGRTDAGVHARGQVVSFQVEQVPNLEVLKHSVNSLLRTELAVLSADFVPDDFHARHSAVSKCYRYTIVNRKSPAVLDRNKVWYVPYALNIERMQNEALTLQGKHDFTSFQSKDCGSNHTEKVILSSKFIWNEPYLVYEVVGQGFLKNMVRIIVGTLVELGQDNTGVRTMLSIIEAKDRAKAGQTAPAEGLCLESVDY